VRRRIQAGRCEPIARRSGGSGAYERGHACEGHARTVVKAGSRKRTGRLDRGAVDVEPTVGGVVASQRGDEVADGRRRRRVDLEVEFLTTELQREPHGMKLHEMCRGPRNLRQ
jgi:hypothetical protein